MVAIVNIVVIIIIIIIGVTFDIITFGIQLKIETKFFSQQKESLQCWQHLWVGSFIIIIIIINSHCHHHHDNIQSNALECVLSEGGRSHLVTA